MDKETETVINKLMRDLKAVKDLSAYLAENNKKLREALRKIENYAYQLHLAYKEKEFVIIQEMVVAALKEGE